jgi:hypothetical protein
MKGLLGWLEDLLRVLVGNGQPQPVPVVVPTKPRQRR